ncbi:oxaloacetate decarboxylase, alpha subunit [Alkalithermobacter thermoalcaliphilus JW-YL-7 = DSM 7308]|uniref:Oxaloacetate decarboxylase, alpha subunit n=1 Tax=Alkalithermobacter thermoalcaliphilus JW-YL-7 = DSM 7308 TaxID=1121328 RepID=A0A150FQP2_CLOPD|nr:Pyruvate carboxylase [[Clostridium] paradoxum JW-YL-7 = DSM 7308]SHK78706.1 oxaloacetate decarboxylase, alpha subunit [[Clostridium] paradoxum JW-YL-7 = DSM 7308]
MGKVKITETIFRDAHQSLIATRLKTEEMLPIAQKLDAVGFNALEVWGGATFDACLRFLNEDPWERLRKLRKEIKNTKLQMLLRGQNLLGYKHYPDDIVEKFIKKSIENGIDIIRVFDALNDIRNLETSINTIKKENAHCQATISYTTSPVHNIPYYIKLAKDMESLGVDSICIKDMAGVITPFDAYELISSLKKEINVPLELHTHYTSGVASMTLLKAIEAGVDIVDTAISPFALGTSQPPTEPLVASLKGTEYDTGLDLNLLSEIAEYFKDIREKYIKEGLLNHKVMAIDPKALIYQVPGGMLSNLLSQLKAQNAEDKYEDVLKEVPKVREDLGYPPLVTPLSQMVGTQAVFNVILGERYKMVPKEIKDYVKGLYGKPPVPIKDEIKRKIIGDENVITQRPADLLEPQFETFKKEISEYYQSDEDVLSYALFPQVAKKYFEDRWASQFRIEPSLYDEAQKTHPV